MPLKIALRKIFFLPTASSSPGGQTAKNYLPGNVTTGLSIVQQTVGKSLPQIRKYHANVATNYYLRGLTGKRARITERARDSVRPGAKRADASVQPQAEPAAEMAGAVEETSPSE